MIWRLERMAAVRFAHQIRKFAKLVILEVCHQRMKLLGTTSKRDVREFLQGMRAEYAFVAPILATEMIWTREIRSSAALRTSEGHNSALINASAICLGWATRWEKRQN